MNIGEGYTEFERYDRVKAVIQAHHEILSEEEAISLLAEVGVKDGDMDKLQWSVLYNLTTGDGWLYPHRNVDHILEFNLGKASG